MVAALKARGIAVAGADRLRLTEQIAVQDLMALGDFLTLPEDDLALAEVLKSPLFGLDDDDLLRSRAGRKGTLWKALLDHAGDNPRFEAAADDAEALAHARRLPRRRSSSSPTCSIARACAPSCSPGSAPRPPTRSTSSSTWR